MFFPKDFQIAKHKKMTPPGIPKRAMHQNNVFSSADWTRVMDRLLQLKVEGYWIIGKENERACARAIGVYNGICGTNFNPNFGLCRVCKLHKRNKCWLHRILMRASIPTIIFNTAEDADGGSREVIQISSDTKTFTDHDSSIVEIPNSYGSSLTGRHYSGGSSLNTDSIFYNELAWNYSDSETKESKKSFYASTGLSTNTVD